MHTKRSTSLMSTLIGIAVLVVIATIAIPAWRRQQTQDHVAAALKMADAAKVVVMEAATVHGDLLAINASALDFTTPVANRPYVASISIADGGIITLVTKDTGATPAPVLVLTPSSGTGDASAVISWTCSLTQGDASAVPETCRNYSSITPAAAPASAATANDNQR